MLPQYLMLFFTRTEFDRYAARNGKKLHLFVKFSPQEYYYQGIFELVDYTYEDEKDEDGNIRKEYKFRLRKVVSA